VYAKIRYKDEGAPALVHDCGDGRVTVHFDAARRAVTPGQSVVFYEGDDLVGGAIITKILE
jgi:tRNA-specific 2-thiouridylase